MMKWEQLLSHTRLGQEHKATQKSDQARTGFQVDYDRVVFSPAFRRLQNKTQVFPLPKSDFVRNRLTHSLETASVGRSLGNITGEMILDRNPGLTHSYQFSDFGALVSAACLAHDIGNPPFGHAGEDAISSYFRSPEAQKYVEGLTMPEKQDLQNFEGNAAGFRILSHTPASQSAIGGGLGLCYSTYASFVKYPRPSHPDLSSSGRKIYKKYSFFSSEREVYQRIADHLSISYSDCDGTIAYHRYPLAFLVEASDDICYTIIDFEDGYQMGLIPFDQIETLFMQIIGRDQLDGKRYASLLDKDVRIAYLRSKAINTLVQNTAEAFMDHESAILEGKFDGSILDSIIQGKKIEEIKKISYEHIYTSEYILKVEAAGYKVLPGLLDFFIKTVFSQDQRFFRGARKLIPDMYLDKEKKVFGSDYEKLLNVAMHVASMTDQHAISLYRDINGISLSSF